MDIDAIAAHVMFITLGMVAEPTSATLDDPAVAPPAFNTSVPGSSAVGVGEAIQTYSYDVHGRLVRVDLVQGSPADAQTTFYNYDATDNRTGKTVTGVFNPGVLALPLPGFPVIPLGPAPVP